MCRRAVFFSLLLLWLAGSAHALVIAGGSGTENQTNPNIPDVPWDNITSSGGGSAIYVGNGWVLQTTHQGSVPAKLSFSSVEYDVDAGSVVRLKNFDNTDVDARMYKLTALPPLPSLALASSSPTLNTPVYMIGYGRHEPAVADPNNRTYWDTNTLTGGGVWTEVSEGSANASGYKWGAGGKRWAENVISGSAFDLDDGFGVGTMNQTRFQAIVGSSIAAAGDSGGGLFLSDGTLAGMITTIFLTDTDPPDIALHQPSDTAVFPISPSFSNRTASLDIATYRSQILAIVPEPSVFGLLGGLGAIVLARRPGRTIRRDA